MAHDSLEHGDIYGCHLRWPKSPKVSLPENRSSISAMNLDVAKILIPALSCSLKISSGNWFLQDIWHSSSASSTRYTLEYWKMTARRALTNSGTAGCVRPLKWFQYIVCISVGNETHGAQSCLIREASSCSIAYCSSITNRQRGRFGLRIVSKSHLRQTPR